MRHAAAVCAGARGVASGSVDGVIQRVLREWREIKAPRLAEMLRGEHDYPGSVDLVRRKLSSLRPRQERAAQRTGSRPGQVVQFDCGEMATRPRIGGVASPRLCAGRVAADLRGAAARFSFDMTIEAFLEGRARAGVRLVGRGATRVCL